MKAFLTKATVFSTRQIADRCGVTQDAVCRWIRDNHLPALRLPGCYRIPAESFEAWLADRQNPTRSAH